MARILVGPELWRELKRRAARSRSLLAAVGYVGRHPRGLFRWPKQSVVVADLSERAVRTGASSARGALSLANKGVGVYRLPRLHAKVYLFDRSAIVCSANLSRESADALVEAGVVVTNRTEITGLRRNLLRLLRSSVLLDKKLLTSLMKFEPRHRIIRIGRVRKGAPVFTDGRPVWMITCVADDEESTAERAEKTRKGKQLANDRLLPGTREVKWLNSSGVDVRRKVGESDWVFFWWEPGRRAKHGWLEGPCEALGVVDLGKRFRDRRYCLALVSRGSLGRTVASREVRPLMASLGMRVPKIREAAWYKADKSYIRGVTSGRMSKFTRLMTRS